MGPAATEPINMAKIIPIIPELFPMYFISFSLGIHTSTNPNKIITGGRTESICNILEVAVLIVLVSTDLLKKDNIISTNKEIKNDLYLFKTFIIVFI